MTEPPAIKRNKANALRYIEEVIGRQDLELAATLLSPNGIFWQIGKKLELAGSHTLAETFALSRKSVARFPDGMTFHIATVTAEGNRVAIEAESEATLANGKPYSNQYVFVFYFDDDGRIVEFREYWDTLYAFETMFEGKTTLPDT